MKIKTILVRLFALVAITALGFLILTFLAGSFLRAELVHGKEEKIKAVTEISRAMAVSFYERHKKGEFDEKTAQDLTRAAVRAVRFDGNNYAFIASRELTCLAHGGNIAYEGKDFSNLADTNGFKYVPPMAEIAKKGGGSIDYYMPKAGTKESFPKRSYAFYFEPWGWTFGAGVYIDDVEIEYNRLMTRFSLFALGIMVLSIIAAFRISRSISKPIKTLAEVTKRISAGDYSSEIPALQRADEIGTLAQAVAILRDEAHEAANLRRTQEEERQKTLIERQSLLNTIADHFEKTVKGTVNTIITKVHENDETATEMTQESEKASKDTAEVERASLDVTQNLQTVAAATEELSASVGEISQQVQSSYKICTDAVQTANDTNKLVQGLSDTVSKIGEVVKLINAIADQTNLLALNATIEAARAGDAGKGFAVVAGEVKSLANQTAKATGDIEQQINAVKGATTQAVSAIKNITGIITKISETTSGIAAAVEEQSAATKEISRNIQQATNGATNVSTVVSGLTNVLEKVGGSAAVVLMSSSVLKSETDLLHDHVDNLLKEIRS